jgi:hypothetical protein
LALKAAARELEMRQQHVLVIVNRERILRKRPVPAREELAGAAFFRRDLPSCAPRAPPKFMPYAAFGADSIQRPAIATLGVCDAAALRRLSRRRKGARRRSRRASVS